MATESAIFTAMTPAVRPFAQLTPSVPLSSGSEERGVGVSSHSLVTMSLVAPACRQALKVTIALSKAETQCRVGQTETLTIFASFRRRTPFSLLPSYSYELEEPGLMRNATQEKCPLKQPFLTYGGPFVARMLTHEGWDSLREAA